MPGPGCGECTAPQTGPGILLLGLGLSEGLGSTGATDKEESFFVLAAEAYSGDGSK